MTLETIQEIGKAIKHITIDSNSAVAITDKIMKFIWFKEIIIPFTTTFIVLSGLFYFAYKEYKRYYKKEV